MVLNVRLSLLLPVFFTTLIHSNVHAQSCATQFRLRPLAIGPVEVQKYDHWLPTQELPGRKGLIHVTGPKQVEMRTKKEGRLLGTFELRDPFVEIVGAVSYRSKGSWLKTLTKKDSVVVFETEKGYEIVEIGHDYSRQRTRIATFELMGIPEGGIRFVHPIHPIRSQGGHLFWNFFVYSGGTLVSVVFQPGYHSVDRVELPIGDARPEFRTIWRHSQKQISVFYTLFDPAAGVTYLMRQEAGTGGFLGETVAMRTFPGMIDSMKIVFDRLLLTMNGVEIVLSEAELWRSIRSYSSDK